jgi:hypothetical protein
MGTRCTCAQPSPRITIRSTRGVVGLYTGTLESGHSDQAIPEPVLHTGGVAGLYSPDNEASASYTHNGQEPRQLQDAAQTVPAEMNCTYVTVEACAAESVGMHELEMIRDYGRAHEWVALVINNEEVIPAERADWLDFVWLSLQKDQ